MTFLPAAGFLLMACHWVALALRTHQETTAILVTSALLMFAACWASATHLLGARAALRFVAIAVVLGFFAEQMGATRGWFFGEYHYTDVLGPRIGAVPAVIPLQWFAVAYMGYVLSNLIVWRAPVDSAPGRLNAVTMSFLGAMIVTAFDLGADPYFVFQLKAWVMVKTDGAWFGETAVGFVGWMVVAFAILLAFRATVRRQAPVPSSAASRRHALLPLGLYGGDMVFQACVGLPLETRIVALFAMGTPLLCALAGFRLWQAHPAEARP